MEQWKDIQGYEGLYEISNEGNVKSLWYGNERILKPAADGGGYLYVSLCKDGKVKHHQVHRLVASAFIENNDNLPQVNHKDEDKTHNCVENLEWCSHEYNTNYGTRNERVAEAHSIPVDMLTKDGELIRTFPSAHEAMRWLRTNGFSSASQGNITMCCQGKRETHCGFKWQYSKSN